MAIGRSAATALIQEGVRVMLQDVSMRGWAHAAITLLFVGLLVAPGGSGRAIAADDEMLDVKILRNVMEGLGLKRDGGPVIDYRERSPLVVPPTRDLPPPEDSSLVERDPVWPDDPDVRARREAATRERKPVDFEAEARPLLPSQLDGPGQRRPSPSADQARPVEEAMNQARPWELGFTGFKDWRKMLGFGARDGETAVFRGEPSRTDLTKPPPGYLTPSPGQPYGYSATQERVRAADPMDQAVGEMQ